MSKAKLPSVSGRKICKALTKAGFAPDGIKGSHMKLKKESNPEGSKIVIVPLHDSVKRGVLINIIKQSGLNRDEFLEYLN